MRPHRAFVESIQPQLELTGREAHHLLDVLRAREGDRLTVFDGKGLEGRARVLQTGPGWVCLEVEETWPARKEPPQPITPVCGPAQGRSSGRGGAGGHRAGGGPNCAHPHPALRGAGAERE
ncbi:RNA methyltransferase PUA domain-containing protein [Meiothermus taiwanensis]|uniref:RNA methyltransferase PUA domain-containing protein n=1 Tax=Meiothermus taiwanensis TaxID=172827 RepID=UPI001680BA88|nr:RNA methyltransferase PUA domain-containing protein [Meiothermus taiwanensis]